MQEVKAIYRIAEPGKGQEASGETYILIQSAGESRFWWKSDTLIDLREQASSRGIDWVQAEKDLRSKGWYKAPDGLV